MVGIGTTNPRAGLEVLTTQSTNGNVAITDNDVSYLSRSGLTRSITYDFNSNNYTVSIIGSGLIYAQSYVGASDKRIKNIVEINDAEALQN